MPLGGQSAFLCRGTTSLLQATGTLGLIATNTVAQGDTREVGLDAIVATGFTITRAIQSRSWPAASANLKYAAVWGTLSVVTDEALRVADDTTGQVVSDSCVVFATDDYGDQAVLSSSLHQLWAITYGSTLETRIRYTPSDVFDTFPRPVTTDRLTDIGRSLDAERREIMRHRNLGLTKLYNLVNDPAITADADVARMRDLHVEVDEAVLTAFGWTDVASGHGFHTYRQVARWGPSAEARAELLDRLLLENQSRAAATSSASPDSLASGVQPEEDTLFD